MSSIFTRIRKNRLLSQGSIKLTNENSAPLLRSERDRENYETAVTGVKQPIETVHGAEPKITVGENAMPLTPPKSPPKKVEHVDALDFKRFYETIPDGVRDIDVLEPTRSISEASVRSTGSIASDLSSKQTQITQPESTTSNTPPSPRSSELDPKGRSNSLWRAFFKADVDAVAPPTSGCTTIHSRLCAFYVNKVFDLGDRSKWSEALDILEKAIQHGYLRGDEVKELIKNGQRDEISARAMKAIHRNDTEKLDELLESLKCLGHVDEVKKLEDCYERWRMKHLKLYITEALANDKWDLARDYLNKLDTLGLPQSERTELRSKINYSEILVYQTQFVNAMSNDQFDKAKTVVYWVDNLRNHNSLAIETAEKMMCTLTEKRSAGWRAQFDRYFDTGNWADAEDMAQKILRDNRKNYSTEDDKTTYTACIPEPEDLQRIEKLYRLMASKSCSLRRWADAANYLNRLEGLLSHEPAEVTEAGEIQKTRTAIKFLQLEANLRSKNWDAASTIADELSQMALPQLERAYLSLRKTQLKYWRSMAYWKEMMPNGSDDGLLRTSAPTAVAEYITAVQGVKHNCEETIHLLGSITPEPAPLKEAISLMVSITTVLNEVLETEAYQSLLPANSLVLGNRIISAETTDLLRLHNLSFDPITWECNVDFPSIVKALHAMNNNITRELLEILLDDMFVLKSNAHLEGEDIPVLSSLLGTVACLRGDLDLLRLLVDRGLHGFTQKDMSKWRGSRRANPLLAHAIRSNNIALVSYIYSKKWHPKEDMTMVLIAIGTGNFEIFKMMIDQGRGAYGDLNAAISMTSFSMGDGGVADVTLPVRRGMGIGLSTWYPDTLLHFAILREDHEMVYYLLENGAGTGGRSLTALDWAIWVGDEGIVKLLNRYRARTSAEGQKMNKKNRSSFLNQKATPRGSTKTIVVLKWYCCKCGDGPLNANIAKACPNCGHYKDSSCMENGENSDRDDTPSRLENRHLPEQRL